MSDDRENGNYPRKSGHVKLFWAEVFVLILSVVVLWPLADKGIYQIFNTTSDCLIVTTLLGLNLSLIVWLLIALFRTEKFWIWVEEDSGVKSYNAEPSVEDLGKATDFYLIFRVRGFRPIVEICPLNKKNTNYTGIRIWISGWEDRNPIFTVKSHLMKMKVHQYQDAISLIRLIEEHERWDNFNSHLNMLEQNSKRLRLVQEELDRTQNDLKFFAQTVLTLAILTVQDRKVIKSPYAHLFHLLIRGALEDYYPDHLDTQNPDRIIIELSRRYGVTEPCLGKVMLIEQAVMAMRDSGAKGSLAFRVMEQLRI
ncbi:MAG: hypothetical protein V1853_02390 [bacterium]